MKRIACIALVFSLSSVVMGRGFAEEGLSRGYLLELKSPPVVAVYVESVAAKAQDHRTVAKVQGRLKRIAQEQQAVLDAIAVKGGTMIPLYQSQRVFNGIALHAAPEDKDFLEALPEVKRVHPLPRYRVHNSTSVPFIGAPAAWDPTQFGLTGESISVGIIDTGIDYLHPDFGGLGDPDDYARNDNTVLGDIPFPTEKIVGGYDFVGDVYDPNSQLHAVPEADPDPMDQHGHGTHVAGTAAGFGITEEGVTYRGSYDASLHLLGLAVGPGVAPEADLYALKVFGESGESEVMIPAIEWAVDPNDDGDFSDHLDVINLSIGEFFALGDSPNAQAVNYAAEAGVIVVASAGNEGDAHFVIAAPASATQAIAVAGSQDDDPLNSTLIPDHLYQSSSRGPAYDQENRLWLKPDLTAPGYYIRSAGAYLDDPESLSSVRTGTSMAAPHVSGMMALLREAYPTWSVAELKALVMNTATHDLFIEEDKAQLLIAPVRSGAGRVDVEESLRGQVIAYSTANPEAVSLSFESHEVLGSITETQSLTIENKGSSPASYTISTLDRTTVSGVQVEAMQAQTGPIAAGGSVAIELRLSAQADQMQHNRDAAARTEMNDLPRQWISESAGYVLLTPLGEGSALRVPYYAALRPVAQESPQQNAVDFSAKAQAEIPLQGTGLDSGDAYPLDISSYVSAFEWLGLDSDETEIQGADRTADIRYIGMGSDYKEQLATGGGLEETTLYLAVAMKEPWWTFNNVRINCFIDLNDDGLADRLLYSSSNSMNRASDTAFSDVYRSRLAIYVPDQPAEERVETVQGYLNEFSAAEIDSALLGSDVVILPMKARDLGLSEAHSHFTFHVVTANYLESDVMIDESDVFFYTADAPGVSFPTGSAGLPAFFTNNKAAIPVEFDLEAYRANGIGIEDNDQHVFRGAGSLGVLLFFHHNENGNKAQTVALLTAGDTDGDMISDVEEGGEDSDGDGLPNTVDTDSDGDGLLDFIETTTDIDGDGKGNYLDDDSDDDGVNDGVESREWGTNPYLNDSDHDGILDGIEGNGDFDLDTTINALDEDSDGDGITDFLEGAEDFDEDGAPNFLDTDADDDSILDEVEGSLDIDEDGAPNYLDEDADGDGLSDRDEANVHGTNPVLQDSDEDGRLDKAEVEAGTNPVLADPPDQPANIAASKGTFADHIEVSWDALPGSVEYRVYRAADNDFKAATLVSEEWQSECMLKDYEAAAPEVTQGSFCRGAETTLIDQYYWVEARVNPSNADPTDSCDAAGGAVGHRAAAAERKSAQAGLGGDTLLGLLLLAGFFLCPRPKIA